MIKNGLLLLIWTQISFSCFSQLGCTDAQATNFDQNAEENDGSCTYPTTTIVPLSSVQLDAQINETSGLIFWENNWWTQNDDTDTKLYAFSETDGSILSNIEIQHIDNKDWEEIGQDESYIYIGDFGNNVSGNRTDLYILRVLKSSFPSFQLLDTIRFSYADQTDFSAQAANTSNFDCESFVVGSDSIFVFRKEWTSKKTHVYGFPKVPGNYVTSPIDSLNIQGLVTGAVYLSDKKILALSAYTTALQPFVYLFYDFEGNHFFKANKRKININLNFHQIESISTLDGLTYYCTNERFHNSQFTVEAKFHQFDLSSYLNDYMNPSSAEISEKELNPILIYPSPSSNFIQVKGLKSGETKYSIFSLAGKIVQNGIISEVDSEIEISKLKAGNYTIQLDGVVFRFVKI